MLSSFAKNAGSFSVAWFFVAACGASVLLRLLDLYLFLDEDEAMVSELCAFGAFAAGAAICVRRNKGVPVKMLAGKMTVAEADGGKQRTPPRRAAKVSSPQAAPANAKQHTDSTMLLLSRADSAVVSDVLDAGHKGSFVVAEKRFRDLAQSLGGAGGARDAPDEALTRSATPAMRPAQAVHSLVEVCIEAGDAKRASTWLEELHNCGLFCTPKTLHWVLDELSNGASTHEAKQLFTRMLAAGAQMDITCYQLLFERLIDDDAVEDHLKRLGQRGASELVTGYIALIRSYAVAGNCERAEHWMSHCVAANVAKSPHQYNAVIHACARVGDIDRAEYWLDCMEKAASAASSAAAEQAPPGLEKSEARPGRSLTPDVVSYSAIMDACAQRGETKRAETWFNRMVSAGVDPDTVSFNTLIKAHARASDIAGAERWLVRARKQGVHLDAFGYNAVIAAAARSADPETAEHWLRQMLEDGSQPDVVSYNSVIHAWAKQGDGQGAQRLIKLMCENGVEPDVVTLGVAVHACARAGDADRAEEVFRTIVARGHTKPDAISYNALINAAVKAGNTERAEKWLASMIEAGVAPSVVSYTTVLHAHARAGQVDAAERGLERMLADGVEANVVSYSALIHACVKAGDVVRAEKWFEQMRKQGVQANAVSYSTLLNVCAKAGDFARAERWLELMCTDGVAPNVVCYNNVIDACSKAGRADRAELWLRRLVGDEPETGTAAKFTRPAGLTPTRQSYTTAAQAHATHGAWVDVERLLAEMEARGIQMDEFSLTVLLSAYSRSRPRQRERAETAFGHYCERGLHVTRPPLSGASVRRRRRALRAAAGGERSSDAHR